MRKLENIVGAKKVSENKTALYAAVGLGIITLILLILFYQGNQTKKVLTFKIKNQAAAIKELETPKYDAVNDFLTDQCETKGAYCISTETSNPSMEILKFLVNFREMPEYSYRLFFEVRVSGDKGGDFPYQLKCNGAESEFYVCQEITATRPTDVIRVFEPSFRTLSKNATYHFNLMVKPVGEIQHTNTITMTPNPNLKVINNTGGGAANIDASDKTNKEHSSPVNGDTVQDGNLTENSEIAAEKIVTP